MNAESPYVLMPIALILLEASVALVQKVIHIVMVQQLNVLMLMNVREVQIFAVTSVQIQMVLISVHVQKAILQITMAILVHLHLLQVNFSDISDYIISNVYISWWLKFKNVYLGQLAEILVLVLISIKLKYVSKNTLYN